MSKTKKSIEKLAVGNKNFEGKKKRRKWWLIPVIFFGLIVIIIIGISLYLHNSMIDYEVDSDWFDEDEFFEIYINEFDGEVLEVTIEESIINGLIEENEDQYDSLELPLGEEIRAVCFSAKDRCIYIDLKGMFINTTLKIEIDISVDDYKGKEDAEKAFFIEITDMKLGKWEIPLPRSFILNYLESSDVYKEGIAIPDFMTVEKLKIRRDGVDMVAEVNDDFVEDVRQYVYKGIESGLVEKLYMIDEFENHQEYLGIIYDFVYYKDDGGIFIKKMCGSEEAFEIVLGIMDEVSANELIDYIQEKAIYIDADKMNKFRVRSELWRIIVEEIE